MGAKNNHGQSIAEFSLVSLFVLFPLLTGGITWFCLEMNRSKCAYLTFLHARQSLIRSSQAVVQLETCGTIREEVRLVPLEALDLDKGALGTRDLTHEVSQLSGDALRSSQRLRELASSVSSSVSTSLPEIK